MDYVNSHSENISISKEQTVIVASEFNLKVMTPKEFLQNIGEI